jgi:PAS domain S-box-containing protein
MNRAEDTPLLERLSARWDAMASWKRILWIMVGSLALSEAITAAMSLLLLGRIDGGYLLTGCVASVLVSLLVSGLIRSFDVRLERERHRSLQTEARGRAFLDAVLDALPIPTLVKDESGRFVVVSREACVVLQKPREALIGSTDAEVSSSHVARIVAQEDAHVLATGRTLRTELQLPDRSGILRWFEKCKSAVMLDGGARFIIASTLDIDERRRAEEALRESEAFLRAATWATDVSLWSWSVRDDTLRLGEHLRHRLGYSEDELRDDWASLVARIHPDDQKHFAATRNEAIASGQDRCEQEFRIRHRDGYWVWILSRARIERDADGQAIRFVGGHLDITARKASEAIVRDHRDALAQEVAIRTTELVAARDAAEAANRAKSAFLANMSHALRTPLHSVLSFSRLGHAATARADAAPEKLTRYFGNIEQSATRLQILIDDLLDLSALEAGTVTLVPAPDDPETLAASVLDELRSMGDAKRIELSLQTSLAAAPYVIDGAKLARVLHQLLSNAIRYSPEDTKVVVRLLDDAVTDGATRALRVEVIDEGMGIAEADLTTVFDRFVEGSKTRSGAGGTGLGLAICRHIVGLHGGSIWAQRNATRGTTMVVVLPQPDRDPQTSA